MSTHRLSPSLTTPQTLLPPPATNRRRPPREALPRALRQRLEMPDGPARGQGRGRGHDGVGVDAVVAIKLGNRAGLAEMFHPERPHPMALDGAEPGQRGRMA